MEYRYLGRTGLKVSALCMGTMTFGEAWSERLGGLNQQQVDAAVGRCLETGINFFDTANVYSYGESETLLGRALAPHRERVVIATKVRMRMPPEGHVNDEGLSRAHIVRQCEQSLLRLGTDWIDLYQVHAWDPATPLEETMRALDDLVRAGKVRYLGASNYAAWQLTRALWVSDRDGLERFETLQALYNLVNRDIETELAPLCEDQNLGILCWSPLAGGFLTGKYRRDRPRPRGTRHQEEPSSLLRFQEADVWDLIDELDAVARQREVSIAQVALNWLLTRRAVSSVILGARTLEQLEDNLGCVEWTLQEDEAARLDERTASPQRYPQHMIDRVSRYRQRTDLNRYREVPKESDDRS
jgi:aryl-alcohol dehydrogenase-like predicted oxidoreductase